MFGLLLSATISYHIQNTVTIPKGQTDRRETLVSTDKRQQIMSNVAQDPQTQRHTRVLNAARQHSWRVVLLAP